MPESLTRKLIESHLVEGTMAVGEEIGLRIDQTLTQDATGTLVMLELEAIQLDRVKTEVSVQYVDHNLIQEDSRNHRKNRRSWPVESITTMITTRLSRPCIPSVNRCGRSGV